MAREGNLDGRVGRDSGRTQGGTFTPETFLTAIIDQAHQVFTRQDQTASTEFANDITHRKLMNDMLNVKLWAKHKLQLYLDDTPSISASTRVHRLSRAIEGLLDT